MKVLAINGSPHKSGTTHSAIEIIFNILNQESIDIEEINIGSDLNRVCTGCFCCDKQQIPKCIFTDDRVNEIISKCNTVDGLILASPVHFSGIAGGMKSFLDRFMYLGSNGVLQKKVGMSVVTQRRAGGVAALDQLNHYFEYVGMPIVTSCYLNIIHGIKPEEIYQDEEGKNVLENGARNMAWLLKNIEKANIEYPIKTEKIWTNFIR